MALCQIMQSNHMQCPNPATYMNAGVDYCRLHFCFFIAKNADQLSNPTPYAEEDQADLDKIIKFQLQADEVARKAAIQAKFAEDEAAALVAVVPVV